MIENGNSFFKVSFDTAENGSEGSAERELENIQKGIDYSIQRLQASFQELSTETINADADISDDSDEQNYFLRYEVMRSLLLEKYPKTDASLLDHIIETIYDKIFLA